MAELKRNNNTSFFIKKEAMKENTLLLYQYAWKTKNLDAVQNLLNIH